jgi:tRNA modification GTPase
VADQPLLVIINKVDLITVAPVIPAHVRHQGVVMISALQGEGIDRLEAQIVEIAESGKVRAANLDVAINQRQAAVLTRAAIALDQVLETIGNDLPWDFWTIDLRTAIQALGEVTGEELVESVLERIFSRFCIGK